MSTQPLHTNHKEPWLITFLQGFAAILGQMLDGSGMIAKILGSSGVVLFREVGKMLIRGADVIFGWISLSGLGSLFLVTVSVTQRNWASAIIAIITFAVISELWDTILDPESPVPSGLKWVLGIVGVVANFLDSLIDSLAGFVITGVLALLVSTPYSQWPMLWEEHAFLMIVSAVLGTTFFIISFFGELITKIMEYKDKAAKKPSTTTTTTTAPQTQPVPAAPQPQLHPVTGHKIVYIVNPQFHNVGPFTGCPQGYQGVWHISGEFLGITPTRVAPAPVNSAPTPAVFARPAPKPFGSSPPGDAGHAA